MAKYVCVDVGGTFTDVAVYDEKGDIATFKSPTTPHNFTEGIINALSNAAEYYNINLTQLLVDASIHNGGFLTHGSTIATNAVLERKTGKVGIICTKGFRDVLLFREGPYKDPYNPKVHFPEPFVPRYLTLSVKERIDSEGNIVEHLDETDVIAVANQLKEYGVEVIVVCFLWSTVNPKHENKAKDIIRNLWPDMSVVLSSTVNPQVNEYRRWVSAAIDASLKKLISDYITGLNKNMNKEGFIGEVGLLNSFGGVMSTEEILERPIYTIGSGPAMAPVAARTYAQTEQNDSNAVVLDMGGTTFDVSCIIDDYIAISKETLMGDEIPGINRVGVHSIGAGGGSIAWVDKGGMLRVGPQSAGSVPGPACYNQGGILPTVTDANVVLGYLNPHYFNEGRQRLNVQKAYTAIEGHIANKLHIDIFEAAYAIWATINANMISAIKDVTVWQGVDPRGYIMIAGGGACGSQAIALAEGLEMKRILIPRMAGGLSAVGGLFSNQISEYMSSLYTETRAFDHGNVSKIIAEMYRKAVSFLDRNNILPKNRTIELYFDGRYPSQAWDLTVLLNNDLGEYFIFDEKGVKELEEAFHLEHERTFGIKDDTYVNCFAWRVKAIGKPEKEPKLKESRKIELEVNQLPADTRKAYFKKFNALVDTPVYRGSALKNGSNLKGPAIIEEPTTTIVVLPGYTAEVTSYDNYYIKIS